MKRAYRSLRGGQAVVLFIAAMAPLGSSGAFGAEPAPGGGGGGGLSLDPFRNIMTSPTLTGDWGGTRTQMEEKGIKVDISLTQVYQGVLGGGFSGEWQYSGRENITINLDSQKMGLWPGGFLMIEGEGRYGEGVGRAQTGAFLPANANSFFPEPGTSNFDLVAFMATQFVSPNLGFFAGKVDTSSGDANAFAHGKGNTGFMNFAFSFNPILIVTSPYSALAAGAIILPTGKPEEFIITISAGDSEGRPDTAGFDTVFKGGTFYAAEGRYTTHFFDMTGHHLLGGVYSDRLFVALDQRLLNFIIPELPIQTDSGSFALYYNFDQYIYQPDPRSERGVGIFGRVGVSDGEANPIKAFFSAGIVGKGIIPGRENDSLGLGYYYYMASDVQTLDALGFGDAMGGEIYYEIAITPWLRLTPDIQFIKPGQNDIDCSVVLGVRLDMKF
jgi:porin